MRSLFRLINFPEDWETVEKIFMNDDLISLVVSLSHITQTRSLLFDAKAYISNCSMDGCTTPILISAERLASALVNIILFTQDFMKALYNDFLSFDCKQTKRRHS